MKYSEITAANVRKLLIAKHISICALAIQIGVASSTLTDALRSKNGMSINMLGAIADYFALPVSVLCDAQFDPAQYELFANGETAYQRAYAALDQHGRELVDLVLKKELERCAEHELLSPAAGSGECE